jgi:glycosyltransferase involved in cell wall biosynthesis
MKPDLTIFLGSLEGGGVERVMSNIANKFSENDYTVDVVLVSKSGIYLNNLSSKIRVINLNRGRSIFSIFALARYLRKNKPKALLSAIDYINVIAIVAHTISLSKAKLVVSERADPASNKKYMNFGPQKIVFLLMKILYPLVDKIICISNGIKKELISNYNVSPSKAIVIFNPIDIEQVNFDKKLPSAMDELCRDYSGMFIIGSGRLVHQKDFSTLIRAFSLVREQKNCKLIILGEGVLLDSLSSLASELNILNDVEFVGFVDNPYPFYYHSDVFVLSSIFEGFGNVLIEAIACNCKIVSTDCPYGPSDILENGKWGALTEVSNVETMADAILNELSKPADGNITTRALDFNISDVYREYESVCFGPIKDC